ncbi:dihydrofolate reductase [Microbacterium sp. 77mftsu3.1]|uniref:dihydrofolate reductase n=1 Tax=Microbacterium sp. 77mftsu3.1 TaxID=1761802 RepID=UPI00037A00F3|nr:dihydrofolate reductase [Microbacterium sp. 77mftsu3.1]SDH49672.1 dihydrofolate reductase [Microbacterium sp. 77mftsu3.1]
MLAGIWAQAHGGVIGADGTMPWHLPEDLAHFKNATAGAPVIMGRRTWESLPAAHRPLPGRANIVLTRDRSFMDAGASAAHTLETALTLAASLADDAWVIGGAQLYELALPLLDEAWVTEIDLDIEGDTRAPALDESWVLYPGDEGVWQESKKGLRYRFLTYRR